MGRSLLLEASQSTAIQSLFAGECKQAIAHCQAFSQAGGSLPFGCRIDLPGAALVGRCLPVCQCDCRERGEIEAGATAACRHHADAYEDPQAERQDPVIHADSPEGRGT